MVCKSDVYYRIVPQNQKMMKSLITAALVIITGVSSFAQKPVISTVDRMKAANQEIVTIKGSGFGTNAAVFFGATKGTLTGPSTDQLIEVKAPAGATYDKISVSNLTSGLTAYTPDSFLPSFGGDHGFGPTRLEGQKDFPSTTPTPTGLYDVCVCDFNSDGKVDIATANSGSVSINLEVNTTAAPGLSNISFTNTGILINTLTLLITCGDLNGDGKPEMLLTEEGENQAGDRLYILQNTTVGTGTPTFTPRFIRITGKKIHRTKIADLDGDGKPEIVVSHRNNSSLSILVNQSALAPAAITFATTPITYPLTGFVSSSALAVDDLNGDGLPEIVTTPYLVATSPIAIIANNSTPGNIVLGAMTTIPFDKPIAELRVGDLDNDQKPDIACTFLIDSSIGILRNQSSGSAITFAPTSIITTEESPWGLDFGDLDGDGKTDIVVASVAKKSLTIFNNESTPGNLAFQTSFRPTTYVNRHLGIGDMDGDGKPDITFASVDKDGVIASKISILRNTSCVRPKITPEGPHNICASLLPLKLTSSVSPGTTYEWKDSGTPVASSTSEFYNVTVPGTYSYTVTAHSEGGTCSLTSTPVAVDVDPGATTGPANPTNVPAGPVCIGSPLNLSASTGIGATRYEWTGPDNYSGSGPTVMIPDFQETKAGRYYLEVYVGTCVAQRASTVVDVIALPEFRINNGGSDITCTATKTLSVASAPTGFTYQWFKSGASIPGATGSSYIANASAEYYVEATYTGCTAVKADPVTLTFATAPVPAYTIPATACLSQNITFVNQSVTDPALPATYAWDFGDNNTSSEVSPVHKYLSVAIFSSRLTVSYSNGACAVTTNPAKAIEVKSAPAATISSAGNKFSFCPGDSLRLEVTGAFTAYSWSNGATTQAVFVKNPGTYSVDVTTTTGCAINATREVKRFEEPEVTATATPAEIAEGQASVLAASGLQTYLWEPAATLSSATDPNPTAMPSENTVYTVKGKDANGCKGEAIIEVRVREGSIYSKITPSKFFSPDNGDETGNFWVVEKIEEYPACQIAVYDDKGIKVHEAKPYLNNWDGTLNGRKLPDGVYYFVIKCEGDPNKPKTGSITLLR
jgi:gliding motility-associated-like protein